jgi:dolichol-phosphate mannosyltransferase
MADMSVKAILGTPNTDHTNGFRCYRVSALKNVNFERLAGVGYVGQTLLENVFYKFGFRIKEVPCAFRLRGHGRSKMGRREMIGGLRAMLKLRMNYIRRGREYYRHSDKS